MKIILAIFGFILCIQTVFAQDINSLFLKIEVEKNNDIRLDMLLDFFPTQANLTRS